MDSAPLPKNYDEIIPDGPEDRHRQRTGTFAIALIVSAAVNLASAVYLLTSVPSQVHSQVTHATLRAALNNCLSQRAGRFNANRQRFALREILGFDTDLIGASVANERHNSTKENSRLHAFLVKENGRLNKDLATERGHTPGLPTHLTSLADVQPFLADVPFLRCSVDLLTK